MRQADHRDRAGGGVPAAAAVADLLPAEARRLGRFSLLLAGDALAPRHRHGERLVVDADALPRPGAVVIARVPAPGTSPETDRANVAGPDAADAADAPRLCAMVLNGDGDLTDAAGGYVPHGAYYVLGVVCGSVPPPMPGRP